MAGLLLLLFLIVPIVELYVMVQVGSAIGVLPTVGLLLLFSVAGVVLVKFEGLGVLRRFRRQLEQGDPADQRGRRRRPVLFGGALLIVPGFVTDFFGLLLLIPPSPGAACAMLIAHRYRARLQMVVRWATAVRACPSPRRVSTTPRTWATSPRPSGAAATTPRGELEK